jgi:hypothetical protein
LPARNPVSHKTYVLDKRRRPRLLRQATAAQRSHPTYYGGAWQALGSALLSGGSLSAC